jgi:streptogramin lyase
MIACIRHYSVVAVFCGAFCIASGQPGALKFDHISLEQGLSQSTVNAIVQDGLGFLWFGTQDGLNRYDGYSIAVYKHALADSQALSDNGIWSLCRDRNGDIWIGTMRGGLNCYHTSRGSFTHFFHDPHDTTTISENNVTTVFEDSRGMIWAGTLTSGLNCLDPRTNSFTHFRHDPAMPSGQSRKTVRVPSGLPRGVVSAAIFRPRRVPGFRKTEPFIGTVTIRGNQRASPATPYAHSSLDTMGASG